MPVPAGFFDEAFHGEAILGFLGGVELAGHDFRQRFVEAGHGMPVPGDAPFLVDHEGMGDAALAIGSHVIAVRLLVLVDGHRISHLVAHFIDEAFDDLRLFAAYADHDDALVLEFFLQLGEVWNAGEARWAPSGPKLHHVNCFALSFGYVDGVALDPLGDVQGLGFVAEICDDHWWRGRLERALLTDKR